MYDAEPVKETAYVVQVEKKESILEGTGMNLELFSDESFQFYLEKEASVIEPTSAVYEQSFYEKNKRLYLESLEKKILSIREKGYKVTSFVLASFLGEPLATFKSSFCYPVGYRNQFNYFGLNPISLSPEQTEKRPILLLHGNYHNQSAFLFLAKILSEKDLGPVYTLNLHSGPLTEKDTDLIQEKIHQIQSQYEIYGKKVKIDLVGHSRGAEMAFCMGMDKSCWEITPEGNIVIDNENFEKNPHIGRVIRLGLSTSDSYRDQIDEKYLEEIYEIDAEFDLIREHDEISHQDPTHRLELPCGHVGLLQTEEALEQIADWLTY